MMNNSVDSLQEFDSYNVYRSVLDKMSIQKMRCECGNVATFCQYLPEVNGIFPVAIVVVIRQQE
ncbi:hypothetical protein MOO45_08075 (plasmid) [Bombilactobacillus folatiphilus]|uniref:Uncharacterized protein n=1 Tax=Bombilactobacillus folatiphilus TaxID=2923362 RepID=A0ABY4P725_9LACO|nr:hypothetical protein [Bombilactobacillus folatiphilus]UQS81435.1 hypothetical protein MOO45_04190 [Bombilactobacillus folatiphilus]UQS82832.1 hypothetical protein MOO45_04105 [Bombilactobacillus folatiphilus]UQS82952.1 hypothetical protein MOO45_08075 [Bombilactobacillus folatiphilus]